MKRSVAKGSWWFGAVVFLAVSSASQAARVAISCTGRSTETIYEPEKVTTSTETRIYVMDEEKQQIFRWNPGFGTFSSLCAGWKGECTFEFAPYSAIADGAGPNAEMLLVSISRQKGTLFHLRADRQSIADFEARCVAIEEPKPDTTTNAF